MRPEVVVVGSLHYDIMVKAPHRPREGETVIGDAWWPKCGGKGGNQAVEASLAGARVVMIGAVGTDDFGAGLLANLDAAGVDASRVARLDGRGSGMSVAIEDAGGDYAAVVVSGANRAVIVDAAMADSWGPGTIVVLQNEIPAEANRAAAALARVRGCTVLLNAAPALPLPPEFAVLIDILVVNAVEAEMLGAGAVADLDDARAAAAVLAATVPTVLVTAGGAGVAYADREGTGAVAAEPVTVVSTHGAGDCFVGTLAAGLARGIALTDAIAAANRAAGRLVSLDQAARASRRRPDPAG